LPSILYHRLEIPDATRHADAKPNNAIEIEHDIFSFISLLRLYLPSDENENLESEWKSTPKDLDLHKLITWLENFDASLVLKIQISKSDPDTKGTGYPTKITQLLPSASRTGDASRARGPSRGASRARGPSMGAKQQRRT
jgi:hypothetical protein